MQTWKKNGKAPDSAKCLLCEASSAHIHCVDCKKTLAPAKFHPLKLAKWQQQRCMNRAVCQCCDAKRPVRRQWREKVTWQHKEDTCSTCFQDLPPPKFDTKVLSRLEKDNQLYLAICGSCSDQSSVLQQKPVACNLCGVVKPRTNFSLSRRRALRDYARWRCIECDFPPCESCGEVPLKPKQKPYTCNTCQFPPCGCGKPRPQSSKYNVKVLPSWECAPCRWRKESSE